MKTYSRVAVLSCGLMICAVTSETAPAQTRIAPSQFRSAPARPSVRSQPTVRRVIRRPTITRSTPSTIRTSPQIRSAPIRTSSARTSASQSSASRTPSSAKSKLVKDEIPPAALLTDYGTELADRLRRLRYSESQLGSKHPSLADVREQIEDIKLELKTWDTDEGEQLDEKTKTRIAKLDEDDLRLLVVRLSQDISKLRGRVAELESEQAVASKPKDEEPKQTVSK